MIDVVSGELSKGRDWAEVWSKSENCRAVDEELERLKKENKDVPAAREDDKYAFAATSGTQLRLVTKRASVQVSFGARRPSIAPFDAVADLGTVLQLWRDTEYVMSSA